MCTFAHEARIVSACIAMVESSWAGLLELVPGIFPVYYSFSSENLPLPWANLLPDDLSQNKRPAALRRNPRIVKRRPCSLASWTKLSGSSSPKEPGSCCSGAWSCARTCERCRRHSSSPDIDQRTRTSHRRPPTDSWPSPTRRDSCAMGSDCCRRKRVVSYSPNCMARAVGCWMLALRLTCRRRSRTLSSLKIDDSSRLWGMASVGLQAEMINSRREEISSLPSISSIRTLANLLIILACPTNSSK